MSLSTALAPMFARMLEFVPKMQKEERGVRQSRENETLPILKEQSALLEILPFLPETITDKVLLLSLWT
jgi:hypothetical protein